jgi:hypothetical protein
MTCAIRRPHSSASCTICLARPIPTTSRDTTASVSGTFALHCGPNLLDDGHWLTIMLVCSVGAVPTRIPPPTPLNSPSPEHNQDPHNLLHCFPWAKPSLSPLPTPAQVRCRVRPEPRVSYQYNPSICLHLRTLPVGGATNRRGSGGGARGCELGLLLIP